MILIKLGKGNFAYIDEEDYERVNSRSWYRNFRVKEDLAYALSDNRYKPDINWPVSNIRMHRFILDIKDPKIIIDHIDGNGLNNQRDNLRISTFSGNGANRRSKRNSASKYLGVSKNREKWKADITINSKSIYLGSFKDEKEAAFAYDEAALFYHKEFAKLNFKL